MFLLLVDGRDSTILRHLDRNSLLSGSVDRDEFERYGLKFAAYVLFYLRDTLSRIDFHQTNCRVTYVAPVYWEK